MKHKYKDRDIAGNIVLWYKKFTGKNIKNSRQLQHILFIAYGLYARKTGNELFEQSFINWNRCPNVSDIQELYRGLDIAGDVNWSSIIKEKELTVDEMRCIETAIVIVAKNADRVKYLLSDSCEFLPWKKDKNLVEGYTEIPFEQIHNFFKDDNNIKILTGEKAFIETKQTEIEK